jgi:hypothetical protein
VDLCDNTRDDMVVAVVFPMATRGKLVSSGVEIRAG